MGLPKHHRLKRRKDFNAVYQRGTRIKAERFSLRILRRSRISGLNGTLSMPSANLTLSSSAGQPTRIGISVSLKVDKRSVVRNLIRRRLQAAFRQLLPCIAADLDILVVVHPPAIQCGYLQFLQELEQLLANAKVLHGN